MERWFNWNNVTERSDGLWVLNDFLTPDVYENIKREIRTTPAEWHSRYANRLISEHGDYPLCKQLGARLLPYLHKLVGGNYKLTTVRAYADLSGSHFFPHLDGRDFALNVQIYLPDQDLDELGTQFCIRQDLNAAAEANEAALLNNEFEFSEWDFYTIPFRANWGYINDNTRRKIHKTMPVPQGYLRESLHMNFTFKQGTENGLELEWYKQIGVAAPE